MLSCPDSQGFLGANRVLRLVGSGPANVKSLRWESALSKARVSGKDAEAGVEAKFVDFVAFAQDCDPYDG